MRLKTHMGSMMESPNGLSLRRRRPFVGLFLLEIFLGYMLLFPRGKGKNGGYDQGFSIGLGIFEQTPQVFPFFPACGKRCSKQRDNVALRSLRVPDFVLKANLILLSGSLIVHP